MVIFSQFPDPYFLCFSLLMAPQCNCENIAVFIQPYSNSKATSCCSMSWLIDFQKFYNILIYNTGRRTLCSTPLCSSEWCVYHSTRNPTCCSKNSRGSKWLHKLKLLNFILITCRACFNILAKTKLLQYTVRDNCLLFNFLSIGAD